MAKLDIEGLLDHLHAEIHTAMDLALRQADPSGQVDRQTLTTAFLRALQERCAFRETVPDRLLGD
jgi:hypothetical protein